MIIIVVTTLVISNFCTTLADNPCKARSIQNESVVCVCDEHYCDTLTRVPPSPGTYVAYTSDKSGYRFSKTFGFLMPYAGYNNLSTTIHLNKSATYQTILGFGGAATDAAGINLKSLPETVQNMMIESYFGDSGIGYSFIRTPIGGCDFSTHPYAYNELPEHDKDLSNFSLSFEDYEYKLPLIKEAMKVSRTPIHVLGTTWSPPGWMKRNDQLFGAGGYLVREYYQTYADYHLKFIEAYEAEGVPVWGLTTTNEPFDGVINWISFNDLGWNPGDMGRWISNNLGPTIRNSRYNKTKILCVDDQRLFLPIWWNIMLSECPEALNWVDGIALHFYLDSIAPPELISMFIKNHPDKFVMNTEACAGSPPLDKQKVILGAWDRAQNYIKNIIENLNVNYVGWIEWNLCLNPKGGPNWLGHAVDSPVIVYEDAKEFIKQPTFYAIGHFSKFIPRGSVRIGLETTGDNVPATSFLTPYNTVVAVLHNEEECLKQVHLRLGQNEALLLLRPTSVVTVELNL